MNVSASPVPGQPGEVRFDNGNRSMLVIDDGSDLSTTLAQIGLPPGGSQPVLLVCGGASSLQGEALTRATDLLGPAVAAATEITAAAVIDGGTATGVMAIVGAARAEQPGHLRVLLGVAPAGQVSLPGAVGADLALLEPNHSHFVLADNADWGDETTLLVGLAEALADGGPVVMTLAGGGSIAGKETLEATRRGWPVFVISGTDGLADSLLALWDEYRVPTRRRGAAALPPRLRYRPLPPPSGIADAVLREIVTTGDLRPVTSAEPGPFARRLAWELQDAQVLKSAWRQFATYDQLAARLRLAFTWTQTCILSLGVIATLLALINQQVGGGVAGDILHWAVVVIPVSVSVLIALASRSGTGQRWVMLRAAAEAIKAEIYRYRTGTEPYDVTQPQGRQLSSQQIIAARLKALDNRLMRTQASSGSLTPYDGPLPPDMFGAEATDDGLSPLDDERYLRIRVADQLGYYYGRIDSLNRRRNALQFLAIAAGGIGTILAAAGHDVWVGLTSATAAAALAYISHLQVDNSIVTYNQAAATLTNLQRGWQARSAGQRTARAFNNLVANAEDVLTTELAGWVQQMSDALRELADRQADGTGKNGTGKDEPDHAEPQVP